MPPWFSSQLERRGSENLKKFISFLLIVLWCGSLFGASAEVVTYKNDITDETTIEEDFQILNIDINEYYKPTKYTYEKWYVIGMSEAYLGENIQTYFYLYNPTKYGGADYMSTPASFTLNYAVNHEQEISVSATKLDYNSTHLIYKVKGFKYSFIETADIQITRIQHYNLSGNGITSDSGFQATTKHNRIDGLQVELKFNTTLIIEEYKVVEIEVKQDDNFINNWNSFWDMGETSMLVYFYNFNFPDHIKYDSVEYAKFSYYYNFYYEKVYLDSSDFSPSSDYSEFNKKELRNREMVVSEYDSSSKTLRVNKHSQEFTFPTFYLGNRIQDKQFGTLDVSGNLESFNYDCSVLLDSTFRTTNRDIDWPKPFHRVPYNNIDYTTLDEVEMIELHYMHEGILYKAQVVVPPVGEEDFDHGTAQTPKPVTKDPWYVVLWKFMVKIGEFLLKFIGKSSNEIGYCLIGILACLVGIACIPLIVFGLIKLVIKVCCLPGKILAKILGG